MIYLTLALCTVAAFAYVTFIVVPVVTRPAMLFDKGPAHARVMGLLICALSALVALFLLNPDQATDLKERFWGALALAGFSAIFWVPWYLYAFTKRAAVVKARDIRERQ